MTPPIAMAQLICLCLYLAIVCTAIKYWPNDGISNNRRRQHLVFGSATALFLLWFFQTGIYQGLNVHFLWLTANLLLLGYRAAVVSSCLALLGITAIDRENWGMFGVNGLLGIIVPMSISYLLYTLARYRLPRHVFVYIFVCGFFAGAVTIACKMLMLGCYYALAGTYSWQTIVDNYLILILLLLFPEGLLNGMTMALMVIYKPAWVYTYCDKTYLHKH